MTAVLTSSPLRADEPATPHYRELRIDTVTSNKMDGVLERFRDTVEPVRRKHSIKTAGYRSAPCTRQWPYGWSDQPAGKLRPIPGHVFHVLVGEYLHECRRS